VLGEFVFCNLASYISKAGTVVD